MAHYSPLLGCTLDTAAAALRISEEASISKDSDPTYTLETCYIYIYMHVIIQREIIGMYMNSSFWRIYKISYNIEDLEF